MSCPLRILAGEPRFDCLPVLRLHCRDDVAPNDRIYAQAQLGLTQDCFFARLWAFENDPVPESALSVLLEGPHGIVRITVRASDESCFLTADGDHSDAMTAYRISGEDLQGEYWGAVVIVPLKILRDALGLNLTDRATIIRGNVLKEHPAISAVFFTADGSAEDSAAFGEFTPV